jgi:cellulose synthase/poly-beta-1,6-N-acetylglucosamine synthase-like glycosyltransferase
MDLPVYLFWITFIILFYTYIGYGFVLYIVRLFRSQTRDAGTGGELGPVTLIIPAYRETRVLEQKIRNSLAIRYSPLEILVVLDGSDSETERLLNLFPGIRVLHQQERKGKYEALKAAMRLVHTPIVIFSDANTMLNEDSVDRLVLHYRDRQVGGVAGEKKIRHRQLSALDEAEGIYWQYEALMKKMDAGFHSVIGAAGELFSIRSRLFQPVDKSVILDDFLVSMQVCLQGYRVAYEPGAVATEDASGSLQHETERKVRIAAGAFQVTGYLKEALNIFRHPRLSFQYYSRRILRWFLCPLLLPLLLLVNAVIVANDPIWGFYSVFLAAQFLFYLVAGLGWVRIASGRKAGLAGLPFYFVFMHYCMLLGLFRFLGKKQPAAWEKPER